ncbi:ribbon-helix-helix protein, CopG family [Lebetimonas sp. JS032]|nr:ribbon-helix-helix protein, CopG family [Lebetimonas sp. JS032]
MLSIRLDKELENKLETIVKQTKKSKSFFIREALKEYGIKELKAIQKVH